MLIRTMTFAFALTSLPAFAQTISKDDWAQWRGPNGNGIAAEGQDVPTSWSDSENVIWKTPVPGRGHSSPTVVGDRIYLTTADEGAKVQSVLAFDRKTGKQAWKVDLHRGNFPGRIHKKNSHATPTVACDGERLYVSFDNSKALMTTALDLDGKKVWQRRVGTFDPQQYKYGYAPSPTIYKETVIVSADYDGEGGYIAALDRKKGTVKWKTSRPPKLNWASPIVAKVAGRDQLLISGCEIVASYDPNSGRQLWSTPATTMATSGTMVWEGNMVFASGGYPKRGVYGLTADGSPRVVWQNQQGVYEQSMLAHDGYIYAFTDRGTVFCWEARSGREMWKEQLQGPVSASPTLTGGNIYASNERGTTYVFAADPKAFKLVAENQLGDSAFATPTICGNRIYIRVGSGGQESLYCIGKR